MTASPVTRASLSSNARAMRAAREGGEGLHSRADPLYLKVSLDSGALWGRS